MNKLIRNNLLQDKRIYSIRKKTKLDTLFFYLIIEKLVLSLEQEVPDFTLFYLLLRILKTNNVSIEDIYYISKKIKSIYLENLDTEKYKQINLVINENIEYILKQSEALDIELYLSDFNQKGSVNQILFEKVRNSLLKEDLSSIVASIGIKIKKKEFDSDLIYSLENVLHILHLFPKLELSLYEIISSKKELSFFKEIFEEIYEWLDNILNKDIPNVFYIQDSISSNLSIKLNKQEASEIIFF